MGRCQHLAFRSNFIVHRLIRYIDQHGRIKLSMGESNGLNEQFVARLIDWTVATCIDVLMRRLIDRLIDWLIWCLLRVIIKQWHMSSIGRMINYFIGCWFDKPLITWCSTHIDSFMVWWISCFNMMDCLTVESPNQPIDRKWLIRQCISRCIHWFKCKDGLWSLPLDWKLSWPIG